MPDSEAKNSAPETTETAIEDARAGQTADEGHYRLTLYVTGETPRSQRAIANLHRICEEELKGRYKLQIVDVLENPEAAEAEKVMATPTLIKQLPPPLRRVIGDLSDKEQVLYGLDVHLEF